MANIIGLITVNGKEILEVDAVPSAGGGTPAPRGSLAMYDSGSMGSLYMKNGTADTAWTSFDTISSWDLAGNSLTGGSPSAPNEFFGSTNNYDVILQRNSVEKARIVDAGLLIGLNASLGGRLQIADTVAGNDLMKEILNPTSNPVINVTRMHRVVTTNATPVTFDIAIPTDYNAKLEVNAIIRQTGGTTGVAGDGASYTRTLHARNLSDTVSILKTQTDFTYEIDNQLDLTFAASGANVQGSVQGVANRDLSWGIHSKLLLINT